MVGTRRVSPYGRQMTDEFSWYLAHNGITMVSGLARSADGIAHETVLEAGGRSIAVCRAGWTPAYSPEHTSLSRRLPEEHAMLSE